MKWIQELRDLYPLEKYILYFNSDFHPFKFIDKIHVLTATTKFVCMYWRKVSYIVNTILQNSICGMKYTQNIDGKIHGQTDQRTDGCV